MARVNEGSHSFTCHPHVLLPSRSASPPLMSFYVPQRVGDWVGLDGWLHTEVVYARRTVLCTVMKAPISCHITPILRSLHWLRITERIEYKLLSLKLTYKVLTTTQPP